MAKLKQSRSISRNFLGLEMIIFNNNFASHFSKFRVSEFSISRTLHRNLAHLKKTFSDKSEHLSVVHLLLLQRDLPSMWQSFWIRLWTVTSWFCSISRVASWCLLKKITKHASLLYLCISGKAFEKARETFETGSILWKLWDYRPHLS